MSREIVTCTSCQARIWWAITIGDKRMPLDEHPADGGNVVPVMVSRDGKELRRVKVLTGSEMPAQGPAYQAHFRSCPNSADHRRRKAAAVPKCRYCGFRLDAWLVGRGENAHLNCGPVGLREAVQTSTAGQRGEALPAVEPTPEPETLGGAW